MSTISLVVDSSVVNPDVPYAGQRLSKRGEPVWELALFQPRQGSWTEDEYLRLEEERFVELVNGCLEFLPLPTPYHQFIVLHLANRLDEFLKKLGRGEVLTARCPIRLWKGRFREPDVFVLMLGRVVDPHLPPNGADLTVEVVSPGGEARKRDLIDKRADYARAGVKEYWIVDPEAETITVLALGKKRYRVHGEFKSGETATSVLLRGFSVDVSAVFAAGQGTVA